MNVYKWDLKRYIKGVLAWSTVLILLQFMYASFYPSFAEDTELITKWMKIMPRAFVKLFGLEDLDFSNILNYLAMVSSIYVCLLYTSDAADEGLGVSLKSFSISRS